MPRRNLFWLVLISAVSLVCYHKTQTNRYGRVLAETLDHVARRYYEPVDDLKLFEGAMKGMMGRLDENSVYFSPERKTGLEETINQQFSGVGMKVSLDAKTKHIVVESPMVGTPAYEAGIAAGDKILKIDGQSTKGMSLDDAVGRMRGKPGTSVVLTAQHEGEDQPFEVTLVRRLIQVDTVRGDTRKPDGAWDFFLPDHDRLGYIRITAFADAEKTDNGKKLTATAADLHDALEKLVDQGMRALVLDLRDDPGGSLRAAVQVCDMFISSGTIVSTRGRDGQILKAFPASGKGRFTDFPMAVLVNQHSASASEIVAACLQDYGRAVVVGQRTFGKGTVQERADLGDQYGTFKLTVATYWRPSGRNIHHHKGDGDNADWGVMPDDGYQVTVDDEELIRFYRWRQWRDIVRADGKPAAPPEAVKGFVDRPLAKAVEYLDADQP